MWWDRYAIRAGVEATMSELKRGYGLGKLRVRRMPRVRLAVSLKITAGVQADLRRRRRLVKARDKIRNTFSDSAESALVIVYSQSPTPCGERSSQSNGTTDGCELRLKIFGSLMGMCWNIFLSAPMSDVFFERSGTIIDGDFYQDYINVIAETAFDGLSIPQQKSKPG